jgi:hypothetical protein
MEEYLYECLCCAVGRMMYPHVFQRFFSPDVFLFHGFMVMSRFEKEITHSGKEERNRQRLLGPGMVWIMSKGLNTWGQDPH